MLRDKLTDHLTGSAGRLLLDPSRCSRMRHNQNSCDACIRNCSAGAVSMEEGITLLRQSCTECMLCVSECPSEAFRIDSFSFSSVIARLEKAPPPPVMGCRVKPGVSAHEKTPCLGFLSEEHLLYLLVFFPGMLQLNLTACGGCPNGFTAGILRGRLNRVEAKTSLKTAERIRLVEKKADLDYAGLTYDRRGFFNAIKTLGIRETASILNAGAPGRPPEAYSAKVLPARRGWLNRILPVVSGEVRRGILAHYYYRVTVDQTCDHCFACVRMCPTGALKSEEVEPAPVLLFNPSLCSGCGLCTGFCRNRSVTLEQGFPQSDPFVFIRLTGIPPQPAGGESASAPGAGPSHPSCS